MLMTDIHNHPKLEETLELEEGHVIIDKTVFDRFKKLSENFHAKTMLLNLKEAKAFHKDIGKTIKKVEKYLKLHEGMKTNCGGVAMVQHGDTGLEVYIVEIQGKEI